MNEQVKPDEKKPAELYYAHGLEVESFVVGSIVCFDATRAATGLVRHFHLTILDVSEQMLYRCSQLDYSEIELELFPCGNGVNIVMTS